MAFNYQNYIVKLPNGWICKLCGYGQMSKPTKKSVIGHLLSEHKDRIKEALTNTKGG